jgi:hypothetical protein
LWAPAVAGLAAVAVWQFGVRGVDVPAQTYYVELFRAHGWVLWDNGWYGGHYLVSYSLLFPPLGGTLGLYGAALVCAATSAWAFARLVTPDTGTPHAGSVLVFAAGTVVAVAIGQVPFLAGVAVALLALLAARRHHFVVALVFAGACPLFSQVAAVFLVLAFAGWACSSPRKDRSRLVVLGLVVLAPLVVEGALFPSLGAFPFDGIDLVALEAVCALAIVVVPSRFRALRVGVALYGAAALVLFLVPNPLGGSYGRALLYFAPALFAFLATLPRRRVLAVLVVVLLCWQFATASSSLAVDPSAHRAYFTPLVTYLRRQPSPGRVEIPFTSAHWEAAYVAPQIPLARGWLRQLDVTDNAVFYQPSALNPTSYHRWLRENGVTWIALPDVALDYSAVHEAALLQHGLPYLHLVWHNPHWRVWRVVDATGLVSGPAHLTSIGPDGLSLDANAAGTALVRVHYTSAWTVTNGAACVRARGNWTEVVIRQPGHIELTTSLVSNNPDCDG